VTICWPAPYFFSYILAYNYVPRFRLYGETVFTVPDTAKGTGHHNCNVVVSAAVKFDGDNEQSSVINTILQIPSFSLDRNGRERGEWTGFVPRFISFIRIKQHKQHNVNTKRMQKEDLRVT